VRRPSGESDVKGRKTWSAAERGHGQDAPSSTPARARMELAAGALALARRFSELGRRLTVMRRVL